MSPCEGCLKRANDPEGNFRMRFICTPNGKLLKGAPGNYKCGGIYHQPYHMCRFSYWELVEETPTLTAPLLGDEDDVFSEEVFVPDDEDVINDEVRDSGGAGISLSQVTVYDEDVNISPHTGATIEPYMTYSQADGTLKEYIPLPVDIPAEDPLEAEVEVEVGLTREELKEILDEAGVEYKEKARTKTLRKLVDGLGPQE